MSIIEVMFAILVTVVGLFGAVAVFPAASAMARKGRVNDAAAAAGRSAVSDFDARGMRRPDRWIGERQNWNYPRTGATVPDYRFVQPPTGAGISFPAGTAFCIDSRMIAFYRDNATTRSDAQAHARISLFPAENRTAIPNVPGADPISVEPRMFRLSLFSGNSTAGFELMQKLQADGIFSIDDDLSYKRPDDDRSKPAEQLYDLLGGTGGNAKRLSDGHLSWMATLVPKLEMKPVIRQPGNVAMLAAQPTDEYVLSIVVFHDREFDPDQFNTTFTGVPGERLTVGQLEGDGATGGEVALYANDPRWLKLRANEWVLLAGVYTYLHPTTKQPTLSNVPAFRWYRVTDCDAEAEELIPPKPFPGATYSYRIYASLMGQDWNPEIVNPFFRDVNQTRTFQATIVEGVVAVYEKTVRLEY